MRKLNDNVNKPKASGDSGGYYERSGANTKTDKQLNDSNKVCMYW